MIMLFSNILVLNFDFVLADQTEKPKHAPDRLLVKFKDNVSKKQKDDTLLKVHAKELSEISGIKVKVLKVPEHALEKVEAALKKHKDIEYVEKDLMFETAVLPNDPHLNNQWYLSNIQMNGAWDASKGTTLIPIAILDTGIDPNHPDLQDKLLPGYNFYDNNNDWSDVCGHGTSVAGVAAAITDNAEGVAGIAWENPIIPIKITSPDCYGYYSTMANGIVFAADNGAKVANISFRIFNGQALTDAAKYMHDRGGWVVASSGNSGTLESYDDNPYIISVSATGSTDAITSFSSYGPYVDFAAPGSGIFTTKNGGSYGSVSGTSFSSPIVAGLVALIKSQDSSLLSDEVYEILKSSSEDLGPTGYDNYYGWGMINANNALASLNPPEPIVDTTLPNVAILSPDDQSDIEGIVTVKVDASDDTAIEKIEFYIDEVLQETKTTTPYDFIMDAATLSVSTHDLKAIAYDTSNNSNFTQISITVIDSNVDTNPPSVDILNPIDQSDIEGLVTVNVSSIDDIAVDKVEFYVNQILQETKTTGPYDFNWDTTSLPASSHILKAVSYDTSNNMNSKEISVNVIDSSADTLAPIVLILNPTDDVLVNGKVPISISATDESGINKVNIFADGKLVKTLTSSPYDFTLKLKGNSGGQLTIMAEAFDNYGNSANDSVTVSIEKTTGGPGGKGQPSPKK